MMKEYVCSVCGYVHKGELPSDFKCPLCGASRAAFKEVNSEKPADVKTSAKEQHFREDRELSAMEISIICSNLARGCEKQYKAAESEKFRELSEFFRSVAATQNVGDINALSESVDRDLKVHFPYAHAKADAKKDRGAKRSLVWSEKVSIMLQSLLDGYKQEGRAMIEHTNVYVCSICGFIYVGDEPPEICPVCKVPSWKFEKQTRRAE